MNVVIVDHPRPFYPERCNDVANAPLSASLNTGSAAAVVEAAGSPWSYHDFKNDPLPEDEMSARILNGEPDLVLVHWVYTWDACQGVRRLLKELRDHGYDGLVAAFGLFPTFCGRELLDITPELDVVLVGEFEGALGRLVAEPRKWSVPGVLCREQPFVPAAPIAVLDALPHPKDLATGTQTTMNVAASRGCNGRCSFCFIHSFYNCARRRQRSAESVLEEVKERSRIRSADHVYFVDPTFPGRGKGSAARVLQIGEGLAELDLSFGFEARVDEIEEDATRRLQAMGLKSVFLGVESASPSVLRRMRKGVQVETASRSVRTIQESGVALHTGFIMFEPLSDLEDLRLNFEFLQEHDLLHCVEATANVLSHSQIVLRNSPAWTALEGGPALDISDDLPFEGKIRCTDPAVDAIARAMGKLALASFDSPQPGKDANGILVDSFAQMLAAGVCQDVQAIGRIGEEALGLLQSAPEVKSSVP